MIRLGTALLLGALLGVGGGHVGQLGFLTLIPWGLAAVAIGIFAAGFRDSLCRACLEGSRVSP